MPYVEVWVEECCGDCPHSERLRGEIESAITKLKSGDQLSAIRILGIAIDDKEAKKERAKENELRKLYNEWLETAIPRPEFLTFAHGKRKATAV